MALVPSRRSFAPFVIVSTAMLESEIYSQLPEGRFAYCHRSVIVNLEMVRSVSPEGITLRDGTPVDTSRRRIPELREALARLHG